MSDIGKVAARVNALKARYAARDQRMLEVQAARRGNFEKIAPDLFSEDWSRPIIANLIDTAARDVAAVLAPLPAFNCSASSGLSESARAFADKRTKIARSYIERSEMDLQMQRGADQYNCYGLLVTAVVPDFDDNAPRIVVEDAVGAYPVWDSFGRTVEFARCYYRDWFSLVADYPELESARRKVPYAVDMNNRVECVKHVSRTGQVTVYLPLLDNVVIESFSNGLGRCHYDCVQRPGLDDEIRGAYDDVIWVQLARHRIQMLLMEGIDKAVRAPLVVPPDVNDLALGPDAVVHTQQGVQAVGRARLDMPPQAFAAVEQLKQEAQLGAMSPEARSGNIDASVITGRGVQQLLQGFSSQIAQAQTSFKAMFRRRIRDCFEMDEMLFGDVRKELRGNDAGVPYRLTYVARRDIDGDHSVDVTYGFAAGLDPNRALVFLLQADAARLVSKDYVRRSLPVDLNAVEEEKKIAVEESRQALVMAFSALVQAIPQMVAAGQDPSAILSKHAEFIDMVQKGKSIEDAVTAVLAPPKPPPGAPNPGAPSSGPGSDSAPGGFTESGLPAGLQPGLATEGPGGRPDLQQFFAGLTSAGNPNLGSNVSRMKPVGV